jgi:hypothetical protein
MSVGPPGAKPFAIREVSAAPCRPYPRSVPDLLANRCVLTLHGLRVERRDTEWQARVHRV